MQNGIEYFFKEGCFIEEWQNSSDNPDMSVARVRVEVGQTTKVHSLVDTCERYVILQGKATVWVDGSQTQVSQSSVVNIPPSSKQSIRNDGDEDLVFLAICTPRFQESNYREH